MQSMKSVYLCAIVLAIVIRPNAAFKFDYVSGDRRVQEGVEIRLLSLVSGGGQLSNNSWKICKWMRGQNICEFQWACKGIGCAIGNGQWYYKKSCTFDFADLMLIHTPLKRKNQLCGLTIPSGNMTLHGGEWTLRVNQCSYTGCSGVGNEVWIEEKMSLDFE
ncbi:uncharacterized protein [Lepeophtheirus salmonis]|uniref:uncharacterized protein isoform X1 n=1 Tax=Lepeophtheirus salmonis TaxID=72036 RepID=UPI001AE55C7D|nr:uncharacterized protein LOC121129301 [Lepeophtheirus salmonis]